VRADSDPLRDRQRDAAWRIHGPPCGRDATVPPCHPRPAFGLAPCSRPLGHFDPASWVRASPGAPAMKWDREAPGLPVQSEIQPRTHRGVSERYGPPMGSQYPLNADSEHLLLEPGVLRVVVSTPAAVELRDLASLRRDFALAHSFLEFYLASDIEGDDAIPSPLDALWISAVTMYGRGFSTGRRNAARADATHLTPTEAADHEYFVDVRNKYIAHAVNGFEKSVVFADLSDRETSPAGIRQIGELHTSLSRLARVPAEKLNHLCEAQIASLTQRIDRLHRNVGQELAALDADAVYALPAFVPPTLNSSDPRSRRS
jgi:hypothetical protein